MRAVIIEIGRETRFKAMKAAPAAAIKATIRAVAIATVLKL
jgi:hypothetical protein